ncbi:MAG: class I SAM-dependent methyltransferase [Planctomycetota bacterium]
MNAATTCCRDDQAALRPRLSPPALGLGAALLAGSALLAWQGPAWWWAAPFSLLAVHLVLLAGVGLGVGGTARAWRVHGGGCCREGDAAHDHAAGAIIRWPRAYDLLVATLTFGLEGRLRRWIVSLGAPGPGAAVLDVGCGTGTLLRAAADAVGPAGRLCGVEPAEEMVEHARRKASAAGLTLELTVGLADRLPYADQSFDRLFCTFVVHHLPPPDRALAFREMRRVLRPGGRLVVVDFSRPRLPISPAWLIHAAGGGMREEVVDERLLAEAGFVTLRRERSLTGAVGAWVVEVPCTPST